MVVHHVTPTQHRVDVATFVRVGKLKMASPFPVLLTASCQDGCQVVHAVLHVGKDPKPGSVRLSVQLHIMELSVTPTQPRPGRATKTRVLFPVFGRQNHGVHALFHVAMEQSQEKLLSPPTIWQTVSVHILPVQCNHASCLCVQQLKLHWVLEEQQVQF